MAFSSLGLSASLLKAIGEQSFTQPTPVQQQAIPAILQGKDILGISKTGSGKTAGYVLPILELCQRRVEKKDRHVRILVIVPTRELAIQVNDVCKTFCAHLPNNIKTMAVYGGVSINPQMMALNGIEILMSHLGLDKAPARSTISDAINNRSYQVFETIYYGLRTGIIV